MTRRSPKKRTTKEDRIRDATNPPPPSEDRDLPSFKKLREERIRRGLAPEGESGRDEEEARQSSLYVGKRAKDLKKEDRDFPYKSAGGTWVHPKSGEYISPAQAKRLIRATERRFIVKNLARETGKTEKQVRKSLKGVSTNDIVGKHVYSKKDPKTGKTKQTRGHFKTVAKKDTRKTITRKGKQVRNPDYGKTKRTRKLVTGPNAKGRKALRKLGIVAFDAQSLLRY